MYGRLFGEGAAADPARSAAGRHETVAEGNVEPCDRRSGRLVPVAASRSCRVRRVYTLVTPRAVHRNHAHPRRLRCIRRNALRLCSLVIAPRTAVFLWVASSAEANQIDLARGAAPAHRRERCLARTALLTRRHLREWLGERNPRLAVVVTKACEPITLRDVCVESVPAAIAHAVIVWQ